MATKAYSEQPDEREEQVKNDLAAATLTKGRRPSVETSLHDAINWPFVVHLHPTVVNGLLCAQSMSKGRKAVRQENALRAVHRSGLRPFQGGKRQDR